MESGVNSGARIGAIMPLAAEELDLVYGGKSIVQAIKGWFGAVANFISGLSSTLSAPPAPVTQQTISEFIQVCADTGGQASVTGINQDGSVNLMLLKADGGTSSITLICN